MVRPLLIISFILFFSASSCPGQTSTRTGSMYWIKYFNKIQFQNNWNLQTEIESRRFFDPERSFHLIAPRVHLHKTLNDHLDIGIGFAYFLLSAPSDPSMEVDLFVPELRPHLDIGLSQSIFSLPVSHRYRLEGRNIHRNDGIDLTDGYAFRFRFRYRLQVIIPLAKSQTFSILVSDEILLNLASKKGVNIYDHNRFVIGPRIKISDRLKVDIVYLNWYQQLGTGQNFASYHVASFTLHHALRIGNS